VDEFNDDENLISQAKTLSDDVVGMKDVGYRAAASRVTTEEDAVEPEQNVDSEEKSHEA
jgi:hypothetical protein